MRHFVLINRNLKKQHTCSIYVQMSKHEWLHLGAVIEFKMYELFIIIITNCLTLIKRSIIKCYKVVEGSLNSDTQLQYIDTAV